MASYSAIAAAYPKPPSHQLNQLSVASSCRGETQSETSSTDSEMSNLHTIAAQLGMNMKELSIDQFKVEREKLETMMTGKFSVFNFRQSSDILIISKHCSFKLELSSSNLFLHYHSSSSSVTTINRRMR